MNDRPDAAARCLEVRKLLRAFADDQLGLTETGTVEGHLLTCRECADLLGRLLIDDVVHGERPLLTPPVVPPIAWFDAFVGAAMPAGGATLHPESPSPATLDAVVRSPAGEGSDCVPFEVIAAPRITETGAFAVHFSTRMPQYEGHVVVCTLMLPHPPDVSFSGKLVAGPGGTCEVRIDEPDVADARARPIAIDAIRVSIIPFHESNESDISTWGYCQLAFALPLPGRNGVQRRRHGQSGNVTCDGGF